MQRVFACPFKHHAVFPCVYHSWKWCATMGKIKFLLPKPLIHFARHLSCLVTASTHTHTHLLFSSLCLICQQPFGVVISPSSVFTCRLTWLAHIRTALKPSSGEPGLALFAPHLGWNVQESQAPSMSCCGSTFKTFPRRTLPDWILASDASCMLMKSSSSSWTLQTHSHTETCVTWNNEWFFYDAADLGRDGTFLKHLCSFG